MNLLEETVEFLKENEKSPDDVLWVGSPKAWMEWGEFAEIAEINYHAGFGAQEIASDLLVVGDGWWMERGEYDGSEGWDFKVNPIKPELHFVPPSVKCGPWAEMKVPK